MLTAQLTRITARLSAVAADAGDALESGLRGFAIDLRKVSDNFVFADQKGVSSIANFDSQAPSLSGQSCYTGRLYSFTPDEVRSMPILSSDQKVIGVRFPAELADAKTPMTFTVEAREEVGRRYRQYNQTGSRWDEIGQATAPWSSDSGKDLIFADAHATGNVYYIQVGKNLPHTRFGRWIDMRVDGDTYGTILAANKYFKQAVRGAPTADLIQLSCFSARNSAALQSSESLHSAGIGLTVHATENTLILEMTNGGGGEVGHIRQSGDTLHGFGSEVEASAAGLPVGSPWVEFKANQQSKLQD
ncbi:hypothetical protein [Nocardia sp. AB354]|uniref:hypothetical protein n=1 Tax=Nocardia sp. AB354 TaxID=3413283 RepID=UPI003C1D34F6